MVRRSLLGDGGVKLDYVAKYTIHHGWAPWMCVDAGEKEIRVKAVSDGEAYEKVVKEASDVAKEYIPDAEGKLFFDITSFYQEYVEAEIDLTGVQRHFEIPFWLRLLT